MLWFWLILGCLFFSFCYLVFVQSKPRHILVGIAIALAILAIVGSLYLIFSGKLQWIWITASGLIPWLSRWFYLRRIFQNWQKKAISKISSEHLIVTISQKRYSRTSTDGFTQKDISLEHHLFIPSGTSLSSLDEDSLAKLQHYFKQHDGEAFHLLAFYGQTSGRFQNFAYTSRENSRETEDHPKNHPTGKITKTQALDILGLSAENYSEDLIIEAHRRLIRQLHPDKGGSDFLAAMINEARDVLLEK